MIQLEHLVPGDWDTARHNFERLREQALDAGGVTAGVRFGTGTLTWPGGTGFTNTLTLPHGLGRTPLIAIATAQLSPGSAPCVVHFVTLDDTDVQWRAYEPADTTPAAATTKTFHWLVIG